MAANSKIEWCDRTWNVITGCNKIAQGCKNCYAERMFNRLSNIQGNVYTGRRFTDVQIHPERLNEPLHWRKPCMVFVDSMSDLFHEKVQSDFILKVFTKMFSCKQHTFQILTKRPKRMKNYIEDMFSAMVELCEIPLNQTAPAEGFITQRLAKEFLNNIWLGVSVSTQEDADKNIPILLETPSAVRWVSVEPMLGRVNFADYFGQAEMEIAPLLDWVVVGCESGNKRRPCKIEWVESIVNQCKMAGVPVFVKQLSINGKVEKDINKFPKHLQIREYPECQ